MTSIVSAGSSGSRVVLVAALSGRGSSEMAMKFS